MEVLFLADRPLFFVVIIIIVVAIIFIIIYSFLFFDCCFTAELVLEVSDETSGPLVNAAQCINFSGKLTLNFTRPPEDSEEIQLISGQCITGDPTVQLLNEKVCVCVCAWMPLRNVSSVLTLVVQVGDECADIAAVEQTSTSVSVIISVSDCVCRLLLFSLSLSFD
jgi:hypothetical protein